MIEWWLVLWLLVISWIAWRYEYLATGLLAAILPTYLLKFNILGIPTTWLELTIYVMFLVWLGKASRQKLDWWWSIRNYLAPVGLLSIGLIIGALVSSDPRISLGIIKGWFVDPLLIYILITNIYRINSLQVGFNYLRFGLWISGTILAVVALWQVISGQFITIDQRASAWFSSANYLSLYLVPIMVLVVGWWRNIEATYLKNIKPPWFRWIIWGGWLLMAGALYFTFSYAGWLALLVGLAVWGRLKSPKVKWWLIWLGILAIVVVSQWQLPKFQQMGDLIGRSSSHVRLQVWQTALLMIKENWLTGIGLGLFEKRYLEFASRLFHPPLELLMLHPHNIFFQFWINTGVIGLGGFLWLVGKWLADLWRAVRSRSELAITIFSAMVALLAQGLLDGAYWKNDLSALFWIIMALGMLLGKEANGRQNLPDRH